LLLIQARNLLDVDVRLVSRVRVRLVKGQDLFLLSFKLAAKLSSLEDLLAQLLVLFELLSAVQGVETNTAEVLLLILPLISHLLFETPVVIRHLP
jgi:hypothetical protein